MKRFFLMLFLLAMPLNQSEAAVVITAENLPLPSSSARFSEGFGNASDGENMFNNSMGQIFTASHGGHLYQINAAIDLRPGTTNAPVKISLMSVINGIPTSVLASSIIPVAKVPAEITTLWEGNIFTVSAVFDQTLTLTAGTQYAILFTSEGSGTANYGVWGAGYDDSYSGGTIFATQNSTEFTIYPSSRGDFVFQVFTSAPEPGNLALCGIAGMFGLVRRSRK